MQSWMQAETCRLLAAFGVVCTIEGGHFEDCNRFVFKSLNANESSVLQLAVIYIVNLIYLVWLVAVVW